MDKTATFIGHSECWDVDRDTVENAIIDLIEKGVETFISGGMGNFDKLGARTVCKLKNRFPKIKNIIVIPYLTFNVWDRDIFDEVIYPMGLEKYHFKSAIKKRNQFLVENSNYAICYVKHSWGGAAKTYEYAKKKEINIVDIGDSNQIKNI